MRIYREKYTQEGKRKTSKKWYIDFVDHHNRRHRMPGFVEKRHTQTFADNIEALISCRISGQSLPPELQRWIEGLPDRIINKFVSWELLGGLRAQSGKPLQEHLENWKQSLVASDCTKQHIQAVVPRAERIIKECGFRSFSDIDPDKVENYLVCLRDTGTAISVKAKNNQTKTKIVKISKATYNYYVRAIKQFTKWLVDTGKAHRDPLKSLKKINITKSDQNRPARTLSIGEVRKLIQTTINAGEYRGISGKERALIYLIANETGLRANEIRTLAKSDFDFDNQTLTVRDSNAKNRKAAILPLKKSTAQRIKEHLSYALPKSLAFNVPAQPHLMIKYDLMKAGIKYKTDEGTAYFHSLRHNFATALDIAAKSAKTMQSLMRHSDPRLTLNIYTHGIAEHERAAIEALPDLLEPMKKAKTGTDNMPIDCVSEKSSAIYSANLQPKDCNTFHNIAQEGESQNLDNALKMAISEQNQISPVRLERTTSGSGGQRSIQLSYGDENEFRLIIQ